MKHSKKKGRPYLAIWDMLGLECLFDVAEHMHQYTEWEKLKIFAILKEESTVPAPKGIPLQMLLLRARVNSQRQYEIYEFNSTLSYTELKDAFNTSPQPIVEWIRKNGVKVYSDYIKSDRKVIA